MVRIVSGQQREDPNAPLLAGLEIGKAFRAASRAREAEQAERAENERQLMSTMLKIRQEQAKALAEVNERAMLGEIDALKQQMIEAEAANLPPDQARLVEFAGLRKRLIEMGAGEKALKYADETFDDYSKKVQAEEERQAAIKGIERAGVNKLADPEQLMLQLDSGRSPADLMNELGDIEVKNTLKSLALTKNAESMTQAEAIVQAMPEGPHKLQGQFELERFKADVHGQGLPGRGPQLLENIQNIGLRGAEKAKAERAMQIKAYKKMREKRLEQAGAAKHMPGLPQMSGEEFRKEMEEERPEIPPLRQLGTHATTKLGKVAGARPPKNIKGIAASLVDQTRTQQEFLQGLRDNGIDPTDPVQWGKIREALNQRKTDVASRAGADR